MNAPVALQRRPLGKRLRFEVFKRDAFTCVYCGSRPPDVVLHCDHVTAVANGGSDDIDNLVAACDGCNLGKGAVPLTALPLTVEEKTARLREREDQVAALNELLRAKLDRIEDTAWAVAEEMFPGCGESGLSRDWINSVRRFVEILPLDDLVAAARRAVSNSRNTDSSRFRYFCAICWSMVRNDTDIEGRSRGHVLL